MSGSSSPIVWAKLKPPMRPEHAIVRPALAATLLEGRRPALVAVVAPAGYGKTMAAADVARSLDNPIAWLTLEPSDNDAVRFWAHLSAALHSAGVADMAAVDAFLHRGVNGLDDALDTLRACLDAQPTPITIVLDDLHLIDNDVVHEGLNTMLRYPADQVVLIATSRGDLALPVGRLRSEGRLLELRSEALAFSEDEVAAVLRDQFGLDSLARHNVSALHQRTDGWPVGVCLAGLGLQQEVNADEFVKTFSGDGRHLSEYLSSEAIDDLDADRRAFLLSTSVVSTLDPELCDELTGRPGSLGMLRALVRDNVFTVALDQRMFRYHPLFAEHLQSLLEETDPDSARELHCRASAWFERRGQLDEAIEHAAAANDPALVTRLLGSHWYVFSSSGRLESLERWIQLCGGLAADAVDVALMMSWVLLNTGRLDEIETWHDAALAAVRTPHEQQMVDVEIPVLQSHAARRSGDVQEALRCARAAIAHADLSVEPVRGPGGNRLTALTGAALVAHGVATYWAQEIDEARQHLAAGVAHARITGELSSVIQGYSYLAAVEAEAGDDDLALAHADQCLEIVDDQNEGFHLPAQAYLARSAVALRAGRLADAENAIAAARRLAGLLGPLTQAAVELDESLLHHALGDQPAARERLRAARTLVDSLPDPRFDERIRRVENAIRFAPKREAAGDFGLIELSEREAAVLTLLPHGLARRELAAQLHVSENTLKTHLTSIRRKLGLAGRASIVERARELGLL